MVKANKEVEVAEVAEVAEVEVAEVEVAEVEVAEVAKVTVKSKKTKYKVLSNIKHNSKVFKKDDFIKLSDVDAESLLDIKVIEV